MPVSDKYCRTKPQYAPYPYTPQFIACPHCSNWHKGEQRLRGVLTCIHCDQLFITTDIGCFNPYNSRSCSCNFPFVGKNKRMLCGMELPVKQQFIAGLRFISVFKVKKYERKTVYHGGIPECLSSLFIHGILSPCELNGVRTHGFDSEECTKYVGLNRLPAVSHSKGLVVESVFSGYIIDASDHLMLTGGLNNLLLNEFRCISGIQYIEDSQSIVFRNDVQLPVSFQANYEQAKKHFRLLSTMHKLQVIKNETKQLFIKARQLFI